MADRTSAELFGTIFELLAENPTDEHKSIAKRIYEKTGNYDFNDYQMYADDALMKLDLAIKAVDPRYPEDGQTIIYANHNSFEQLRGG